MSHPRPDEFSFRRYLAAKRTVDDRALHRPTLARLTDAVADYDALRVLDVAAGLGTGLQRLLDWDCLPSRLDRLDYTLVDIDSTILDDARGRLSAWATEQGYTVNADSEGTETLELTREDDSAISVTVRFVSTDALTYAAATDDRFDLLVGQAFLDLVDLDKGLPALLELVADGGLAYFPITFDGVTHLSPVFDLETDRSVLDAYHATMDAADRPGGSTTGREVLEMIAHGETTTLVAAGGSDWVVHPPYPADEAYFLHHLVDTIADAVTGAVPEERRRAWADARHDAVAAAELTFLAHNVDVLARVRR